MLFSFGRASVGPIVEQPDHTVCSVHPQTDEMLPHGAARREQIHTGTFRNSTMTWLQPQVQACWSLLSPSGAVENYRPADQTGSGWGRLPSTLPQKVFFFMAMRFSQSGISIWSRDLICVFCMFCTVCSTTRMADPTCSTRGSSGPV